MLYFVYETTCIVNGKKYRGVHKTTDINDGYIGSGTYLKHAVDKYGYDNFTREVLEYANSSDELYELEKKYVDHEWLKQGPTKIYNLKLGGHGGFDHISDEQRKVAGIKLTGIPKTEKHKQNLSYSRNKVIEDGRGLHPWKDKSPKDFMTTDEYENYINNCKSKSAHYGESNGFFGKSHTQESIAKMLATRRSYSGSGNPRAKEVTIDGITYSTMKEASIKLNISLHKVRKLIKGDN